MISFLYFGNRHPIYNVPPELAFLEELVRIGHIYKLGIAISVVCAGTYFHAYLAQKFLSKLFVLRQLLLLGVIFSELLLGDALSSTVDSKLISYLHFRMQAELQFRIKSSTRSGLEHSYVELLLELSPDDQFKLRKAHANFQLKHKFGDIAEKRQI